MTIAMIKSLLDACYQAKRIRDLLPPLPKGVAPAYIQYLDAIGQLERQGVRVIFRSVQYPKENTS